MDPRLRPDAPEAAPWLRALALHERAPAGAPRDVATFARGRERLDAWRDELGLTPDLVAHRLGSVGLDEATLCAVLGEDDASLQARIESPRWLEGLLEDLRSAPAGQLPAVRWSSEPPPGAAFLGIVEPLLAAGHARLVEQLAGVPWAAGLDEGELLRPICARLAGLLERPFALELQAAIMLGQVPNFASFVQLLAIPEERVRLLLEHPVLARLAREWVEQWCAAILELVQGWEVDADRIAATFGDTGRPKRLVAVDSDPHRFGRHVWFVDTDGGTRLVYKPRPGAVEAAFQTHVAELGARGLEPDLPTLRVVDGGEHVWIEFAEAAPLADADEARAFHRRQGAWLPVLWTLACTDVHYENVIAAGANPIPVDHETLLRNRVFTAAPEDADLRAEELLGDTVFGVDLLPAPRFDAGFGGAIDQGGMGAGYDETGVIAIPRIVDAGTADMRVDIAPIETQRQPNRAALATTLVDPRDHADDVEDGFHSAWRFLAEHSEEVTGLLDAFAGATVRVILRPTQNYLTLLDTLGHPEFLGDALERERPLMQLWMHPEDQHWRVPTLEHERRQLLVGDVPWFGARMGERALVTGDGHELPDMVVRTGLEVARGRLASMHDPAELDRNRWVVRASLAGWGRGSSTVDSPMSGDPVELAVAIARRLLVTSVAAEGRRSWLGLETVPGQRPEQARLRPDRVGTDLYDGLPGIAAFLGMCGSVTGDAELMDAAREAAATMVARGLESLPGIGAYDGAAGVMWASMLLADALDDDALLDHAERAAIGIARGIDHDRVFDIVSGAAGCIPVLLALDAHRPGAVELAEACARHLVEHVDSPQRLSFARGFSHGPAGIGWSLARLTEHTGDERWLAHALAVVDAEDELLAGDHWTEAEDAGRQGLAAWCHGAPGIALGRRELARVSNRDADHETARRALEATVAAPPHDSHGVCHGEFGTIEVLGLAGMEEERDRRAAAVLDQLRMTGARCTTPRHLETPGLMTGLAGIGWQLLRLAAPDRVPTLLLPGSLSSRT